MQYGEDAKDSISTYYFEAKGKDDDNYKAILTVLAINIMLPVTAFSAFMYIAFFGSDWIADYAAMYMKGNFISEKSLKGKSAKEKEKSAKEKEAKHLNSKGKTSEHTKELSLLEEGKYDDSLHEDHKNNETVPKTLAASSSSPSTKEITRNANGKINDTLVSNKDGESKNPAMSQGANVHVVIKEEEEQREKDYRNRKINIMALSYSFVILGIALFAFHILASVMLIRYGNEVLYDDKDSHGATSFGARDDQCVPIIYTAFSFLPSTALVLHVITSYPRLNCKKVLNNGGHNKALKKNKNDETQRAPKDLAEEDATDKALGKVFKTSFGFFFVYLGFYFLPYMALAFINDPIETGFIYLIEISFVFSLFANFKTFFTVLAEGHCYLEVKNQVMFIAASGSTLAYFLVIFLFMLTLGNFHDFQAIENLTLPIIIGLLSLFVLKPAIKYVKSEANK